jgi:hypothetical protein
MWEELTLPLDFGTIEVTTTKKEENAKRITTRSY